MDTLRLYTLAKKGALSEMVRYDGYIRGEEDESMKEFWNERLDHAKKEFHYILKVLKVLEEAEK